jgi:hypothetical protein
MGDVYENFAGGRLGQRDVDKREWISFHRSRRFEDAGLHGVVMFETLLWMRANACGKWRYLLNRDTAVRAAWYPHIPWTPAPGGVDDEHKYKSRAEVA